MTSSPSISTGRYGAHGSGISVHRAAAMVTGAAGVAVQLAFDATNDNVAALNASLVAGDVVVEDESPYCVSGQVVVGVVGGLTSITVDLYRNGVLVLSQDFPVGAGPVVVVPFTLPLDLPDPSTLQVQVTSQGAGGAPIITGRQFTSLTVAAV